MANTYIDAPVTEQTLKNNRYYWSLDEAFSILPMDCLGGRGGADEKGLPIELIVAGKSMPQDMVIMGKQVRPRKRGEVIKALKAAYGEIQPGKFIRLQAVNAASRQYEVLIVTK